MTPHALKKLDRELTAFVAEMTDAMGRPERRAAMGHYITGLLLDGERKSVSFMIRQRPMPCGSVSRTA
jgi:SRSO17 transposase